MKIVILDVPSSMEQARLLNITERKQVRLVKVVVPAIPSSMAQIEC
jgi:hypothetical protein